MTSSERYAADSLRAELRKVYGERSQDLFAFAYRLTGSERLAEDVVHESVLRILDGRCRLDVRRGDLALLLFGVVRNVARELRRRTSREVTEEESFVGAEYTPPEHALAVRSALDALSDADREVIILSAYHGCTPREIATVLGTSGVVIRVRLHRARTRLKRVLLGGPMKRTGLARALESDHE